MISSLIWLAGFHASIVLGYLGLATAKEVFKDDGINLNNEGKL